MRFSRGADSKTSHKEFIKIYAARMNCSEIDAEKYLGGFVETVLLLIKQKSSITIQNFGKFYVSQKNESTAFKFNPSQKLRAVLGWASSYKGEM